MKLARLGTAALFVAAAVMAVAPGCGRSNDVVGEAAPTGGGGSGGGGGGEPPGDIIDFEPCVETKSSATLRQVNMFIAVDKSGSMANDGKWDNTEAAFTAFFQDSSSATLNVALRLWPDDPDCAGPNCCIGVEVCDCTENCGGGDVECPAGTCDVAACSTPHVALGALSEASHQQALVDHFAANNPDGATPMSAALEGAIVWARDQLTSKPDEAFVIVLVSDGEPHFCNEDPDYIASLAADGFDMDGIPTFAVGLEGSAEATMDAIAAAGGTDTAYFIGSGNGEAELLAALLDIAGQSASCSFTIPEPEAGETLDPRQVRVEYESGSGGPGLIEHVADAAACEPDGGWYYDNPDDPSTVTLCPQTCNEVQADTEAQIDVALGCECIVDEDCPGDYACIDGLCVPPCADDSTCPASAICYEGRCIPEPGDECSSDAMCEPPLRCIGGQCAPDGLVVVGPFEAVQGGAFSCSVSRPGRAALVVLLSWLAGSILFIRRRRR